MTGPARDPVVFDTGQWPKLRVFVDETFGEGFANTDLVCRGEPECYERVLPLIDRLLPKEGSPGGVGGRLTAEWEAMMRFRQNAPMHLDSLQREMLKEGQGMEGQVVMRHYGAPTRILDWTESPWIALYFACEDAGQPPRTKPTRGRVLAFDRRVLERVVGTEYSTESPAHAQLVQTEQGWKVPRLLTTEFEKFAHEWVVCYHRHQEKFPRLVAQQGLFTLGSKPWLDHWDAAKRLCPGSHVEILIEPGLKPEILRRLSRMGVTAAALFPDIEGVAREVQSNARIYFR
jgi:hypothetical protein